MRLPVAAAFVAMSYIWGSTWMFIKIGLAYWPPFFYAGVRNAVAFLAVLGVIAVLRRPLPLRWSQAWPALLFGVLNGSAFALIFWGQRFIPSGQAAVLVASMPFFVMLFARWWVGEPVTLLKSAGVILGFIGVVLTSGSRGGAGFDGTAQQQWLGQMTVLTAALCYGASYAFAKRWMRGDPWGSTAGHLFFSALWLLGLGLLWDPLPSPRVLAWPALGSLLYLALVGSALAYWLMFYLLEHVSTLVASYITLINPVVAVLLGVVFLGEAWTPPALAGAGLVLFGVWLVSRPAAAGALEKG